jgi:DNA-binding transcriptional MocR family regulator
MTLSTRQTLVKLARKYDALIVTDDVYDFLQWHVSSPSLTSISSNPKTLTYALLPRLVDVDRTLEPRPGPEDFGNAISNGSFSKIAGPGIRTGWAEATRKFTYGLSQCGSSRSGGAPSQLTATIVSSLLSSGALTAHIEKVLKPAYQRRHAIMMAAIKKELLPLGCKMVDGGREEQENGGEAFGGYFLWIDLPKGVSADLVARRCQEEEELIVAPGSIFEVHRDDSIVFPGSIRLCFAWVEEADLEEGVQRLASVIKALLHGVDDERKVKITKQDLGEFK